MDGIVRKGRGFATGGARFDESAAADQSARPQERRTGSYTDQRYSADARGKERSRSRSNERRRRSRSRSPKQSDHGGDRYNQRMADRGRSRSRSPERSRTADRYPQDASRRPVYQAPVQGSAIALSNTRKTAELVARQSSASGLVTEDALAALRARMASLSGASQAGSAMGHAGIVTAAASAAIAALQGTGMTSASAADTGAVNAATTGLDASGTGSVASGASRPQGQAGGTLMGAMGWGIGGGMVMPSGTSVIQAPAGVNVNVGTSPAQAAGMLGPGGLVSLLAAISPTRVLVLYNAVTDSMLEQGRADPTSRTTDLADIAVDIAVEAQKASPGTLLRLVVPVPRQQGELIDPPVGVKLGGTLKVVGATGLLEDARDTVLTVAGSAGSSKDGPVVVGANMEGAKVIPLTAESFYRKVVASGTGPGASSGGGWSNVEGLPGTMSANNTALSEPEDGEAGDDSGTARTDEDGRTRGLGKVFLEFNTVDAAVACQKELAGRFLEGRITVATFAHPSKFVAGDLCALGPPGAFVLTASNAPLAKVQAAAPQEAQAEAQAAATE